MMLIPLAYALAFLPLVQQEIVPIGGTVLGPAGRPVEGARVALSALAYFSLEGGFFEEVVTGADGRFELRLPLEWLGRRQGNLHVFACAPGAGIAGVSLRAEELPVGTALALRLRAVQRAPITIVDPRGRPVNGARVALLTAGGPDLVGGTLPPKWVERSECRSDERGRVYPEQWDWRNAVKVRVLTEEHGRQDFYGESYRPGWLACGRIQLHACGELELEVKGEPPAGMEPVSIELQSHFAPKEGGPQGQRATGILTLYAARGEALAHGPLLAGKVYSPRTVLMHPDALRLSLETQKVEAGGRTRVALTWNEGVEVHGRTVDEESGEPVAGVRLRIFAFPIETQVVSDDRGAFRFRARAGLASITEILAPRPYLSSGGVGAQPRRLQIPEGVESFDAGEIELARERPLRGRVVGPAGGPVAGALVTGTQTVRMEGMIRSRRFAALADGEGGFELSGLAEGDRIELAARRGDLRSTGALVAVAGQEDPAELRLVELLAMEVRVSDPQGKALEGAELVVWRESPPRTMGGERKVSMGGEKGLHVDASGRARSPGVLLPDARYCVDVSAEGAVPVRTSWRTGRELAGGLELVLQRTRRVAGRVLDTGGNAVAGARIQLGDELAQRGTRTAADGSFSFDGVSPQGGFLVLEDDRIGVHGRLTGPGEQIEWRVSSARVKRTRLGPVLQREEELALARKLVEPILDRAVSSGEAGAVQAACRTMAWIDPGRVLENLEEWVPTARDRDRILAEICKALARSSPDEARAVSAMIAGDYGAVLASLDVIGALPASARARKVQMLSGLLARAERVEDPARRLLCLGKIGEGLLDLGEREGAVQILRRGQRLVADLPAEQWAGFVRSSFAEELAQIDLEAALKIVEALTPESNRSRHFGNIAQELAGIDPQAAEEVLERTNARGSSWRKERYVPRVCYRMAPVDLERARRIAASAPGGRTLGLMAMALAERDRASARALLAEAFEAMRPREHHEASPSHAGSLLSVAERVDPDRLDEYLWLSVALRRPERDGESFRDWEQQLGKDAGLALFVADYDRELARALMRPVLEAIEASGLEGWWDTERVAWAAAAVVAPRRVAALAPQRLGDREALRVAMVLAREGEDRRRFIMEEIMGLWVVGKEDI